MTPMDFLNVVASLLVGCTLVGLIAALCADWHERRKR